MRDDKDILRETQRRRMDPENVYVCESNVFAATCTFLWADGEAEMFDLQVLPLYQHSSVSTMRSVAEWAREYIEEMGSSELSRALKIPNADCRISFVGQMISHQSVGPEHTEWDQEIIFLDKSEAIMDEEETMYALAEFATTGGVAVDTLAVSFRELKRRLIELFKAAKLGEVDASTELITMGEHCEQLKRNLDAKYWLLWGKPSSISDNLDISKLSWLTSKVMAEFMLSSTGEVDLRTLRDMCVDLDAVLSRVDAKVTDTIRLVAPRLEDTSLSIQWFMPKGSLILTISATPCSYPVVDARLCMMNGDINPPQIHYYGPRLVSQMNELLTQLREEESQ